MEKEEIIKWLKETDRAKLDGLYKKADALRSQMLGSTVCVHGLIEFSNYCAGGKTDESGCLYCGLRRGNKTLPRYHLKENEIVNIAAHAANVLGYKMLVLQSGVDRSYTTEALAEMVRAIKQQARVLIFLSIGERKTGDYQKLWEAGARGMLFRFETSDPRLYNALHPGGSLEQRLDHIRQMKKIGFILASGALVGLPSPNPERVPEQTPESIADDILLMNELGVKMATLGPYIQAPNTPLALLRPEVKHADLEMTLKVIALTRLAIPRVRIPCTTALETLGKLTGNENGVKTIRRRAIRSGATAFMLSLTPPKWRGNYLLYQGKDGVQPDGPIGEFNKMLRLIKSEGRKLCAGWGGNKNELTLKEFNEGLCVLEH